ncbi:MAG: SMC-Scp complex subunit ScpB [Candidatus Micrarchaeia archaeon]
MEDSDYKNMIEAALFMSSRALSSEELAKIIGLGAIGQVEDYVKELINKYNSTDTALEIINIGGKYMLTVKERYASKVSSLASGPDISRGALRLLAYISKNNGILQSELVKAFGESTYDHVKELVEKEFIMQKKQGRSKKLFLTSKFAEYFSTQGTASEDQQQQQNENATIQSNQSTKDARANQTDQ